MTPREAIVAALTAACPDYTVTYESSLIMNTLAGDKPVDAKFIYVEEFVSGRYIRQRGRPKTKVTNMRIYFCQFKREDDPNSPWRAGAPFVPAVERELVREEIEASAVLPFLDVYEASPVFLHPQDTEEIPFGTPLPRFDDGEVSIMLEIGVKINANSCV